MPAVPSQIRYREGPQFRVIYLRYHSDCVIQIRARLSVRWKQKQRVGLVGFRKGEKAAEGARRKDNLGKEKSAKASVLCFITTTVPHVRVHASLCHTNNSGP